MGRTDLSRVSLYSVRITSVDVSTVSTHPWCCSVDSATYKALLSLNCQGVDIGCTWSTLLAWLGFVQPVNLSLYFMAVGTAEGAARLGATWRCRVMFSARVAETATLGGVALNNIAVGGKMP